MYNNNNLLNLYFIFMFLPSSILEFKINNNSYFNFIVYIFYYKLN